MVGERAALVADQGDERRDDQDQALAHERRQGIAEGLAAARREHRQAVAACEDVGQDLGLMGAQLLEAERLPAHMPGALEQRRERGGWLLAAEDGHRQPHLVGRTIGGCIQSCVIHSGIKPQGTELGNRNHGLRQPKPRVEHKSGCHWRAPMGCQRRGRAAMTPAVSKDGLVWIRSSGTMRKDTVARREASRR